MAIEFNLIVSVKSSSIIITLSFLNVSFTSSYIVKCFLPVTVSNKLPDTIVVKFLLNVLFTSFETLILLLPDII